ncbi:unnamed protein product [Dovyalis caffra]|uniref:Maturase K n=1 Tax=Dovyalis caffra TaxID=77055 RepID=A0AAV1RNL9_9ROSI|nr:unnamed protein product [Dovyalis caffra]
MTYASRSIEGLLLIFLEHINHHHRANWSILLLRRHLQGCHQVRDTIDDWGYRLTMLYE